MVNAAATSALVKELEAEARRLGFVAFGIAPAERNEAVAAGLDAWLAAGMHGSMRWMAERARKRRSPQDLWPQAKSVISLGMSYAPQGDPLALASQRDVGWISAYARGRDYHDTLKKALKALARHMIRQCAKCGLGEVEVKVFVDTAPVMEKPLAQAAGLGWQGKHTNLVSREHGSWLFLGEILTTLELPASPAESDHCGSCNACQRACPTHAFPAPYRLDARRCISYLTIEHKGPIPLEFREAIGNRIYGCDDCLAVCPWNKFARSAQAHRAFLTRAELAAPPLAELLQLDDAAFRALFSGSPIKRIGRNAFIRNCLIAAGNSGQARLLAQVAPLCRDSDPVVAEAAAWAAARLRAAP